MLAPARLGWIAEHISCQNLGEMIVKNARKPTLGYTVAYFSFSL